MHITNKNGKKHSLKVITINVNGLQLRQRPEKLHQMITPNTYNINTPKCKQKDYLME
jgi:hypothetical protein